MNKKIKGIMLLCGTAFFWGTSFTAQSAAMYYIGPFAFQSLRFLLAALVLLPGVSFKNENLKKSVIQAALCGILLFVASSLLQIGLIYNGAAKAGFLNSLYLIEVPLIGAFFGKKLRKSTCFAAITALAGVGFLCLSDGFSLMLSDTFIIAASLFFALHILALERYASNLNGTFLACIQYFTVGFLSAPFAAVGESVEISKIFSAWLPILYSGVFSCAIGFTMQIYGQKYVNADISSFILSFEAVFAAAASALILGDRLTSFEVFGCLLMLLSVCIGTEAFNKNSFAKRQNE